VIVLADSSPLVILSKLGCFDLLNQLFLRAYISPEVQYEVVIAGAGLPEASGNLFREAGIATLFGGFENGCQFHASDYRACVMRVAAA